MIGKRSTWVLIGILTVAVVIAAVAFIPHGPTLTKRFEVENATEFAVSCGELRIIQEDVAVPYVIVRSDLRVAPWVMGRQDGSLVVLGVADDSDPRFFAEPALSLVPKGAVDATVFELHAPSVAKIGSTGTGRVSADALEGESLALDSASSGAIRMENLDLRSLDCEMSDGTGDVTVAGIALDTRVTNSGGGTFDGTRLVAETVEKVPGGTGEILLEASYLAP